MQLDTGTLQAINDAAKEQILAGASDQATYHRLRLLEEASRELLVIGGGEFVPAVSLHPVVADHAERIAALEAVPAPLVPVAEDDDVITLKGDVEGLYGKLKKLEEWANRPWWAFWWRPEI